MADYTKDFKKEAVLIYLSERENNPEREALNRALDRLQARPGRRVPRLETLQRWIVNPNFQPTQLRLPPPLPLPLAPQPVPQLPLPLVRQPLAPLLQLAQQEGTIRLFEARDDIGGRTPYDMIQAYGKYKRQDLFDLISEEKIDLSEFDAAGKTLFHLCAEKGQLRESRMLLERGSALTEAIYEASDDSVKALLFDYHPGVGEETIYEYCHRRPATRQRITNPDYLNHIKKFCYDQADTTDAESSAPEFTSEEELDSDGQKAHRVFREEKIAAYNDTGDEDSKSHICLLAYRGMHFSPATAYKTKASREKVKQDHHPKSTT
jgi:hypothetical protein